MATGSGLARAAAVATGSGAIVEGEGLRVLLVSEPGVNGVFRHVEALAHFLLAQGHRVDLAYSDRRGSDRLDQLVETIRGAGGATLNLATGNAPGPGDLKALAGLRSLVTRHRPDVIHAHSSKAGALARLLPLLGIRQPIFYTPHAYYGMGSPSGIKARFFGGIESVLGGVGTTINLSGCERDFAASRLGIRPERQRLIPNPVDTARFVPPGPGERKALRTGLGVPEDALLLGCVGRLSEQKDPLTLYRSFARALARVPQLWLFHLGTGELSEACDKLAMELGIGPRLVRREYLSDPLPFYHAIDAAILTSRYEGLSFAVLEALGCDLPVLLSEAPGNLDFLDMDLSHCWSAPRENPGRMADAIEAWAADHPRRRPSNHRAIAESRFSQAVCFGAVVEEYRRAIRA